MMARARRSNSGVSTTVTSIKPNICANGAYVNGVQEGLFIPGHFSGYPSPARHSCGSEVSSRSSANAWVCRLCYGCSGQARAWRSGAGEARTTSARACRYPAPPLSYTIDAPHPLHVIAGLDPAIQGHKRQDECWSGFATPTRMFHPWSHALMRINAREGVKNPFPQGAFLAREVASFPVILLALPVIPACRGDDEKELTPR